MQSISRKNHESEINIVIIIIIIISIIIIIISIIIIIIIIINRISRNNCTWKQKAPRIPVKKRQWEVLEA